MRRRSLTVVLTGIVVLTGACGGAAGSGASGSVATVSTRAPRPTFALTPEEEARRTQSTVVSGLPTIEPKVLAYAAERTSAQETGRMDLSIEIGGEPGRAPFMMNATGAFDSAKKSMSMRMTVPGFAAAVDVVADSKFVYMRLPAGTAKLPAGKEWVKQPATGSLASSANLDSMAGPASYFDFLRSAGGEVTSVGTDTLDGVTTTHYRTQLTMAAVLAGADAETRKELEAQFDGTGVNIAELNALVYDVDIWLGADGLARQLHMSFDIASLGAAGKMVIKLRLHDLGYPVDISMPDKDLVVDAKTVGLS